MGEYRKIKLNDNTYGILNEKKHEVVVMIMPDSTWTDKQVDMVIQKIITVLEET